MAVAGVFEEAPDVKSFSLDPAGEPIDFGPGQFVNVTARLPSQQAIRRAYSIGSSPLDPRVLLTVKKMPGELFQRSSATSSKRETR